MCLHRQYQHSIHLPLTLQACWQAWWSRTSRSAGARGSALAACTSRGSRTAGNAPAPIKPSDSSLRVKTLRCSSWAWWLWAVALGFVLPFAQGRGTTATKPLAEVDKDIGLSSGPKLLKAGTCPERSPCSFSRRQTRVLSCCTVPRQHPEALSLCPGVWLRTIAGGNSWPGWWQVWHCGTASHANARLCQPQLAVACVLLQPGLWRYASPGPSCLCFLSLSHPQLIFGSGPRLRWLLDRACSVPTPLQCPVPRAGQVCPALPCSGGGSTWCQHSQAPCWAVAR